VNSLIETSKISLNFSRFFLEGEVFPVTQFESVTSETPIFEAKNFCLIPLDLNTSFSIILLIKIKVLLPQDINYYLYGQLEYDLCVISMDIPIVYL